MLWRDAISKMDDRLIPLSKSPSIHHEPSKRPTSRSSLKNIGWYFVKAFILVAFLAFMRDCSPIMPAWILPAVFAVYAAPATIGTMHCVVANRLHKQDLYNAQGKLSHYNRRWLVWFGVFFILYWISALLFALQAPSWDNRELLFVWASPIVFGFVFLILNSICKKEYDAKYYKSRAIKWSILAAALILTIAYAAIPLQPPTEMHIDLHQIVLDRYLPYASSPAPLLAELDKLSTYANCLTEYGINLISSTSYAAFAIASLVISFPVFAGVTSQLGACLLDREEIINEFRFLPAKPGERGSIQRRYFVMLTAIWIGLSGVFVYADHIVSEMRSTEQYTMVDRLIDNTADWATLAAEEDIEDIKNDLETIDDVRSSNERLISKKDDLVNDQLPKTIEQVNKYYDACANNVSAYLEWYNSLPVAAARFIPPIGENLVKDEFDKQIVDPVSKDDLNSLYDDYLRDLENLYDEYRNAQKSSGLPFQAAIPNASEKAEQASIPAQPPLWVVWDSEEGRSVIQKTLLGTESDEQDAKTRILAYIESQREKTIELVNSLSTSFFPSSALDAPR